MSAIQERPLNLITHLLTFWWISNQHFNRVFLINVSFHEIRQCSGPLPMSCLLYDFQIPQFLVTFQSQILALYMSIHYMLMPGPLHWLNPPVTVVTVNQLLLTIWIRQQFHFHGHTYHVILHYFYHCYLLPTQASFYATKMTDIIMVPVYHVHT